MAHQRTEVGTFRKSTVPFAYKAADVADSGTFKGYASVFGNIDHGREIVARGAFGESLETWRKTGDPMPVLWQHMAGQPVGGSDVLSEDDKGLYTEGWLLINEIPQAKIAHTLMKRRVVKGMSIGYHIRGDSWDEKERVLTLTKLDLVEYSIVTFPMNGEALLDEVKSRGGATCDTIREFEGFLRDVGGFSVAQAKRIAAGGWAAYAATRDESSGDGDKAAAVVVDMLKSFQL
jgi:HK97 family phage prohead protease